MEKYNVLWIDDSSNWVVSEKFKIEDRIKLLGVELNPIYRTDGEDIAQIAMVLDVDLVLIDYHLEPFFGDELIGEIRYHSNNDRIPIVFYSQDPDIDLKKLSENYSNVVCIPRNEVGKSILNHIELKQV